MITFDDTKNESAEYAAFVDKFKPKKTTDDCYTPPNIYEAVLGWAVREYRLEGRQVLRPFYPGGDYESEEYPEGCVVIDNPPFSIVSKICRFYEERGVDYFLFAPALTLFSTAAGSSNYIVVDAGITYENGATVQTGFVTNLGPYRVHLAPELHELLKLENAKNTKPEAELPKYEYPDHVITPAHLQRIVKRGVGLRVLREDATFIRALDSQRERKKAIFGGGFLLSERAAAERAAAERAAAERAAAERAAAERAAAERANVHIWELSDRELACIQELSGAEVAPVPCG